MMHAESNTVSFKSLSCDSSCLSLSIMGGEEKSDGATEVLFAAVMRRVIPGAANRFSTKSISQRNQIRCTLRALMKRHYVRCTVPLIWIAFGAPPRFTGIFLYPMHKVNVSSSVPSGGQRVASEVLRGTCHRAIERASRRAPASASYFFLFPPFSTSPFLDAETRHLPTLLFPFHLFPSFPSQDPHRVWIRIGSASCHF